MPRKKSERYYGDYKTRCKKAHESTKQRCSICYGKSTHCHHTSYGDDVIGSTLFPVCEHCHEKICHHPDNWKPSKNPMMSRNTKDFTEWLKVKYLYVKKVYNPLKGGLVYRGKKK